MDLKPNNGAATKTEAATEANQSNLQNGSTRTLPPANGKTQEKPKAEEPNPEPGKTVTDKPAETTPTEQHKAILTLDAKLKVLNDLHRRSIQRLNLISRIMQLESFEVALAQEGDELEENLYQGCKLIIRDDKNREFVTTTPGLIRMVSQFIFESCNAKLAEIEASINFPNA